MWVLALPPARRSVTRPLERPLPTASVHRLRQRLPRTGRSLPAPLAHCLSDGSLLQVRSPRSIFFLQRQRPLAMGRAPLPLWPLLPQAPSSIRRKRPALLGHLRLVLPPSATSARDLAAASVAPARRPAAGVGGEGRACHPLGAEAVAATSGIASTAPAAPVLSTVGLCAAVTAAAAVDAVSASRFAIVAALRSGAAAVVVAGPGESSPPPAAQPTAGSGILVAGAAAADADSQPPPPVAGAGASVRLSSAAVSAITADGPLVDAAADAGASPSAPATGVVAPVTDVRAEPGVPPLPRRMVLPELARLGADSFCSEVIRNIRSAGHMLLTSSVAFPAFERVSIVLSTSADPFRILIVDCAETVAPVLNRVEFGGALSLQML